MLLDVYNCSAEEGNPETCVSWRFITGLRVFQGIASIFGTFGSLLTILSIVLHKRLQTVPNAYVVNLAVTDLIVCSLLLPFSIHTVGHRIEQPWCGLIGFPNLVTLMVSVMNLSLVAFNRYIVVCRSRELYAKIFTARNTALSIALPWILALLFFTPPFYGWGTFDYNTKFGVCIFMSGDYDTYWFIFAMADMTIMFPTIPLTLFSYVRILMKFSKSRSKVNAVGPAGNSTNRTESGSENVRKTSDMTNNDNNSSMVLHKQKQKESGKQIRLVIKNMFVLWITFLTFWMPLVMTYKIDYHSKVPNEVYHILFAVAQSNSAVNFVLYCAMNKNFRESYIEILTLKTCKRN